MLTLYPCSDFPLEVFSKVHLVIIFRSTRCYWARILQITLKAMHARPGSWLLFPPPLSTLCVNASARLTSSLSSERRPPGGAEFCQWAQKATSFKSPLFCAVLLTPDTQWEAFVKYLLNLTMKGRVSRRNYVLF